MYVLHLFQAFFIHTFCSKSDERQNSPKNLYRTGRQSKGILHHDQEASESLDQI